jgi:hypothetical protein
MDQANPEHDSLFGSEHGDNNVRPSSSTQNTGSSNIHADNPAPRHPAPRDARAIKRIPVSDFSNISKIEEPLDTKLKNWMRWSQSMYIMMRVIRVIGYVEGTIKRPDPDLDADSADNWDSNDSFVVMLIAQNISVSERSNINGSETSQVLWEKLKKIHQSTCYLVPTQRIRKLWSSQAKEGDDIPQYLVNFKEQWKTLAQFGGEEKEDTDSEFKRAIAAILPTSWDDFTAPYIRRDRNNNDPLKNISSQEFIGIINQEYELRTTRRAEEIRNPPKGEKNQPSLANRISDAPSNNNARPKRHCKKCDRDGHYTSQCRFIGKTRCLKCNRFGHESATCGQSSGQSTTPSSGQPNKRKRNGNYQNNNNKRART